MTRRILTIVGCALVGALAGIGVTQQDEPAAAQEQAVSTEATVSHAKFKRAVAIMRREHHETIGLRRTLVRGPDAELALQVAGVTYGEDWRAMRACWLSEGYRNAERFQARIVRDNAAGSGAAGPAQFMPGTFAGTPYARFDIYNVLAQAMATAWMWSEGRRSEWAGAGC